MKRITWAALLALPLLAVCQPKAAADGAWIGQIRCTRVKICLPSLPGCCGINGICIGCCSPGTFDECHGVVPGPWYTYWPQGNSGVMTGQSYPYWMYDDHFQLAAPLYPSGPVAAVPNGPDATSGAQQFPFYGPQAAPSYWYGR